MVLINNDGTIAAAASPDLVLGLEDKGCGVAGQWLSEKDGVETLVKVWRILGGFP